MYNGNNGRLMGNNVDQGTELPGRQTVKIVTDSPIYDFLQFLEPRLWNINRKWQTKTFHTKRNNHRLINNNGLMILAAADCKLVFYNFGDLAFFLLKTPTTVHT